MLWLTWLPEPLLESEPAERLENELPLPEVRGLVHGGHVSRESANLAQMLKNKQTYILRAAIDLGTLLITSLMSIQQLSSQWLVSRQRGHQLPGLISAPQS